MPMAAIPLSSTDRPLSLTGPPMSTDFIAKEAILSWFRGEFAAANAIIDALCGHLAQLSDGGSEYESVFAAIHRRRLNWIPVLQMQKYHSIADVTVELRKLAAAKKVEKDDSKVFDCKVEKMKEEEIIEVPKAVEELKVSSDEELDSVVKIGEKFIENNENGVVEVVLEDDDTPESEVTDTGSQEQRSPSVNIDLCDNHEDCGSRPSQIKLTKGFSTKEPVKGHMVNVVKGLKLYEDVFTNSEVSKLTKFVYELRSAGQNGDLSGETFILFNQQIKGNRRELIQLGVPIFGQTKDEEGLTSNIEPIPPLLETVIDHLVHWHLIPEYKRPNGCIICFFEEEEHSQPFQKPPHLDQPISSLFLSESTMVFGRSLVSDNDGNYKGPLMLPLKEGSLLVMRGNSADMARHVMSPSPNKRVSITFFRLRSDSNQSRSPKNSAPESAMSQWQERNPNAHSLHNGAPYAYESITVIPKWGVLQAPPPVVMLASIPPMVMSPGKFPHGGTGVFLPWSNGSKKHIKHLPPRAQKGRFLALSSQVESHLIESTSEPGISV